MINNVDLFTKNIGHIRDITARICDKNMKSLKWNKNSESVMDVGIGDGLVASQIIIPRLPKNFKEYIGCDISEEALESAKARIKIQNVHLVNMDIRSEKIPLKFKNRFDHVFCHRCLHNLHEFKDLKQAFKNFYDMLEPGGQIFITTFEESPLDQAFEILDKSKWIKYNHWRATSCFYKFKSPKDEFKKIMREEGFVDIYIKVEPDYLIPFSEQSFLEAHVPVNPIMSDVKLEDKDEYIQDFIQAAKQGSLVQTILEEESGNELHIVNVKLLVAIATKPL